MVDDSDEALEAGQSPVDPLGEISVPTLIVGSRDESDPEHRLAIAEEYAERIPDAELIVEGEGESPLAWRGGSLSREIDDFLSRVVSA